MNTENCTHENLQAIAYAALAEAEHNAYAPSDTDVPAEEETWAPEPDDVLWSAETFELRCAEPSDDPESAEDETWDVAPAPHDEWRPTLTDLCTLEPKKVDQIYQTMPNFDEWDTHRLIAWYYAIDFTLRERLA